MKIQKWKRKKRIRLTGFMTVISIAIAIVSYFAVKHQIAALETGILDVCADQQDAYVELVLSQITIKENRTSEEMIEKVLSSLDASSNKYWTLSENQELLFVKDVTETNKYKGFTTGSYYTSDSATTFLQNLIPNRVMHDVIVIGEKQYIASGVIFEYGGKEYKLCLLTNREVLLDNNQFLKARIQILALTVMLDCLFILTAAGFCHYIEKLTGKKEEVEDLLTDAQLRFVALNEKMQKKALHDSRNDIWEKEALPDFLKKLKQKNIAPVTIAQVRAEDEDIQKIFLENCRTMLEKNVLRFRINDTNVILLFVQNEESDARWDLVPLIEEGLRIVALFAVENAEELNMQLLTKRLEIGEHEHYASQTLS